MTNLMYRDKRCFFYFMEIAHVNRSLLHRTSKVYKKYKGDEITSRLKWHLSLARDNKKTLYSHHVLYIEPYSTIVTIQEMERMYITVKINIDN